MRATNAPRPRLQSLLDETWDRRLTIIVAGAGSGKTTLLSQWLEERRGVLLTVSEEHGAVGSLSRAVAEKLRLLTPGLNPPIGDETRGPEISEGDIVRADALAASLAEDLATELTRDVVLVLDDLHRLDVHPSAHGYLAGLVRHAPPRLHVVLSSRTNVPFAVSRLILEGEAAVITGHQLSFTNEEARQLVELATGESRPGMAEDLVARTHGWAAAMRFGVQAAVRSEGAADVGTPGTQLVAYLAEEVLGGKDAGSLELLRISALLPWITPDLVKHLGLTNLDGSDNPLGETAVYTRSHDGPKEAVTLSPIVRELILDRHQLESTKAAQVASAAAAWFTDQGFLVEALSTLRRADSSSSVTSFLESHGRRLLDSGRARVVWDALDHLDGESVSEDLQLLEAEARQVLGDWDGALRTYSRLMPETGSIDPGLAWRAGFLRHMRGDIPSALETYLRGATDRGDPADRAALMAWTASAHWLQADRGAAERLAREALRIAEEAGDDRSLATAHTVLAMAAILAGDRTANDHHYLRALGHAERAGDVLQTIRIRSNRGSHLLEEGSYEDALAELDVALSLADLTGFQLWRGMAHSNRGMVLGHLGRLEEAAGDLEAASAIFRELGSSLEAYPLSHLGDLLALQGDEFMARTRYEHAIELSRDPADLQGLIPAMAGLARLIHREDPERALELATTAVSHDPSLGRVDALLALGWVHHELGDRDRALEAARMATAASSRRRELPGRAGAVELYAALSTDTERKEELLLEARGLWNDMGDSTHVALMDLAIAELRGHDAAIQAASAAERLEALGAPGPARRARMLASEIEETQPTVAIQTLGGFVVLLDGEPISSSHWQSRKARDLLKMLLANRGRPLHREVLMDRLWSDIADMSTAKNRLSVALSTVRSVLDPTKTHEQDHFVVAEADSVRLRTNALVVDVETFLELGTRGMALYRSGKPTRGLAILRRAESMYVGDFLEEQLYEEWAIPVREEARAMYITLTSELASSALDRQDYDAAIRFHLRLLERDQYHETAHLGLIRALVSTSRHGDAQRSYRTYVSRMGEIDVEPAPYPRLP